MEAAKRERKQIFLLFSIQNNDCVTPFCVLQHLSMKELLTTKEAAEIVGVNDSRIRQLILAGILPAHKFGKSNVIKREDLKLLEGRESGKHRKKAA